jgi:hypothetical protein
MAGRANLVLDNLIAEKKALPMIVVMPWGHALPFNTRPAAGQPSNNDVFEHYLIKDVIPLSNRNTGWPPAAPAGPSSACPWAAPRPCRSAFPTATSSPPSASSATA